MLKLRYLADTLIKIVLYIDFVRWPLSEGRLQIELTICTLCIWYLILIRIREGV